MALPDEATVANDPTPRTFFRGLVKKPAAATSAQASDADSEFQTMKLPATMAEMEGEASDERQARRLTGMGGAGGRVANLRSAYSDKIAGFQKQKADREKRGAQDGLGGPAAPLAEVTNASPK